jgi:hypothetical protein
VGSQRVPLPQVALSSLRVPALHTCRALGLRLVVQFRRDELADRHLGGAQELATHVGRDLAPCNVLLVRHFLPTKHTGK